MARPKMSDKQSEAVPLSLSELQDTLNIQLESIKAIHDRLTGLLKSVDFLVGEKSTYPGFRVEPQQTNYQFIQSVKITKYL